MMSEKMSASALKTFDLAEHLKTDEDIAVYLTLAIEEDDPSELTHALGVVARARGMSQIARDSGITREALYHALQSGREPRFDTVRRVCHALGLRLLVSPAGDAA